ncbi:hypothetical protein M2283_006259 [Streptomyces pseudovenezuelae]|uniref:Tn3 transposase DDE domain-containing protein n=1 Tax=Streptomyces pseudovenezuelae TaxID=67350 RepID=A0ABT6LRH0_9ACTN|nr:hypothetical protein [Streptomyces pseudovenezuelae]
MRGKEAMMLRVAEAALSEPAGTVRKLIYPVVGGEKTLQALAAEAAANEAKYKARIRTVLRSACSAHRRRVLTPLLRAPELKCNNTAYRPVMDAIDLLQRYLEQPPKEGTFFDAAEAVPLEGVVPEQWRAAVVDDKGRVERIPYELCVLVSLREALRRREMRVVGANRWRNPEDDLPQDFEDNRDVHYDAIQKPQDPAKFIAELQRTHREALDRFEAALAQDTTGGVAIVRKNGEGWIKVSPRPKQEEPTSLVAVKGEIERRWDTIDLLDLLKYAEFDTDFIAEFTTVATRENLSREVLRRRLLLVLFGLGTNMGIKRVAVTGKHGESEATLRRVRHLFVNRAHARPAPFAEQSRACQYLARPAGSGRPGVGGHAYRGGPARAVTAAVDPREPIWPVRTGYEQPSRPGPRGHRGHRGQARAVHRASRSALRAEVRRGAGWSRRSRGAWRWWDRAPIP